MVGDSAFPSLYDHAAGHLVLWRAGKPANLYRRRAEGKFASGRVGTPAGSHRYRQAIQHAFGEVSDALIGYEKLHQVRTRQQDSVADLQETVRISTLRYKGGTTTYLEVLDGQRSLYGAELTLAAARGDEYRSLVQLYKALGGGWQQ